MNIQIIKDYNSRFYEGEKGMYLEKITLVDSQNSNAIIMPYYAITSIVIGYSGSPTIYLTNSSEDDIIDNSAIWETWDGVSDINTAITGIKAENTTGTAVINITVQTIKDK